MTNANSLPASRTINDAQFKFLTQYLSSKYGLRIPPEKRIFLETRLVSRLNHLRMNDMEEYINHTFKSKEHNSEYEFFIEQITTHKTFFFRENYQFDFLKNLIPRYVNNFSSHRPLSIWSAGCSTGEEVYTLGMLLNESKSDTPSLDYKIVGTDISIPSLKKAARGMFSATELENIPENFKTKYFDILENSGRTELKFKFPEILNRIQLGVLNLNNKHYNLPNNYDFIFCRNVTIYFDAKTRNEVLERIVAKLRPGGYLFLGHSETALGTTLPIRSIQPTIYQKI